MRLLQANEKGGFLDLTAISYSNTATFSRQMDKSPYKLAIPTWLFPVYHRGAGSINRNHSMPQQEPDWIKIKNWLLSNNFC
jgi:hypothetical protein